MKHKTTIILALICTACALADSGDELSQEAQVLSRLLQRLQQDPDNRVLQQRYLQQFPANSKDFASLFDPEDFSELYDGYEYIRRLGELANAHPLQVGCILIQISTQASWRADAFNYLQKTTADFALNQTGLFVEILKTYESGEQEGVITFLADGAHSTAPGYGKIVLKLQQLGEDALAARFTKIESKVAPTREH